MKDFELVEDGRLSKSEMNKILGSGYYCQDERMGLYKVVKCSVNGNLTSYSHCIDYSSCKQGNYVGCSPYNGPTGPAGFSTDIPTPNDLDEQQQVASVL